MKFEPWKDYIDEPLKRLPIDEPPCKHCQYWYPYMEYVTTESTIRFTGIICCRADERHNDFSCYREKKDENTKVLPPDKQNENIP